MNKGLLIITTFALASRADALGEARTSSPTSVSIESFGGHPDDPRYNSRKAFQEAFKKLSDSGGGVLSLPPGDYYLRFPDIADNLDPRNAASKAEIKEKNLGREKLLLVPAGVTIAGTVDKAGISATRIHWTSTSFPLFSFVNSDRSGATGITFQFDGTQPQFFPFSQEDFLAAVDYKARWLGGPFEISAVIYTIGSSNLHFENLTFRSGRTPADNEHTFAFGIMAKGKTPVPVPDSRTIMALSNGARVPGGGLAECTSGNTFRSLTFDAFVMGIVTSGQCNPVFENISGDNRGSWFRSFDPSHESGTSIKNIGPPGHLIYLTNQNAYDVTGVLGSSSGQQVFNSATRNSNILVQDINEGAKTLSNFNSLGTLALKNIDGGSVSNVTSGHPAGLIQTMVDVHGLRLENLNWSANRDICADREATACRVPVIDFEPGPQNPGQGFSDSIDFKRVKLSSVGGPVMFKISAEDPTLPLSRNIRMDGLAIECQPQADSSKATIMLRSAGAHLANVTYSPRAFGNDAVVNQAYAVRILSRSMGTTVDIQIKHSTAPMDAKFYKDIVEENAGKDAPPDKRNAVNQVFVD